jgi:hypothetical protein
MKSARRLLFVMVPVALLAMSSATGDARQAAAAGRDISGFWELGFDSRRVPPANLAAGITAAMLAERARKDAHAARWCNMLGLPFIMDAGRPLDIRQGRGLIVIVAEHYTAPRYLYLNRAAHISEEIFDPSTTGDSIARWEGETLVVDTVGFHPDRGITSLPGGGYRTARSRLVERYRLLENGSVLSVQFTWTDPEMFRTPHAYEFRYHRLAADYEPRLWLPCDPYNEVRATFLEEGR